MAPLPFSAQLWTTPGAEMSSLKKADSPVGMRVRKASTAPTSSGENGRASISAISAGLLAVGFDPIAQRRKRLLLGAPAHKQADVAAVDDELGLVLGADQIGLRLGPGQRHDVVLV